MKKVIAVGFLFALMGLSANAQQRAQYSQYMINQYVLNPAVTGAYDYAHIVASYRDQWAGAFDGEAPKTYYVSGHTSIGRGNKKPHPYRNKHAGYHGVGGMVYSDQTGSTGRLGVTGSYAYNERISGDWRLALGVSLGVQQFTLSTANLYFGQPEAINTQRKWLPDANLGFWSYNKHMYIGGSITQIFQNKLNLDLPTGINPADQVGKLSNHYFFTSGIKLDVTNVWAVIPSVMVKFNKPAPVSYDINAKVRYKDMVWLGASYRSQDSFAFLFGFLLNNQFEFGYSYDLTISKIRTYTSGSHEVILGYRLWSRAKIGSPSDFW